jgi:hypothetical protein
LSPGLVAALSAMQFVWFWSFWHWSKESFQAGRLLRPPLEGIGSHWDEWFCHEASERDLESIEETGRSEVSQRQFIRWLARRWAREAHPGENRMIPRFVLGQLAQLPPFKRWPVLEKFRRRYGTAGVSAIVLAEQSRGEPEDVRRIEALILPAEADAKPIVPEGFQVAEAELDAPRSAAMSLLAGKKLLQFLLLWSAGGRRPYPRWLRIALFLGWAAVLGLILFLLRGPEPGDRLVLFSAMLVIAWAILVTIASATVAKESFRAWRLGTQWRTQLERSQVRLRMNGGLTLKGGSAGLPFCLNTLLALYAAQPDRTRASWIWSRFFRHMRSDAQSWAATGVVTATGRITPGVIESKIRACLQHDEIRYLLAPNQSDGGQQAIRRLGNASAVTVRPEPPAVAGAVRLGFAAERRSLRNYPCRHLAQSMMALGGFLDRPQIAANALALAVSIVMVLALPDLRSTLFPHRPPVAVEPASPSPYYLWASLDTKHPEYFSAVLDSGYWSNRRSNVQQHGGVTPSVRAEFQLHRLTGVTAAKEEDGVVWIERRRRFLNREFLPGERVGRYSITYLTRLGHE